LATALITGNDSVTVEVVRLTRPAPFGAAAGAGRLQRALQLWQTGELTGYSP